MDQRLQRAIAGVFTAGAGAVLIYALFFYDGRRREADARAPMQPTAVSAVATVVHAPPKIVAVAPGPDVWQQALDKSAAEREANRTARDLRRTADSDRIAKAVKAADPQGGYKVTETALVMDTESDCDGRMLMRVRKALGDKVLGADGFDTISCGSIGDEIDLHTADGCAPGQSDQLILTDAGIRRDKLTQMLGEGMGEISRGFLVNAMGCDATVLTISQISDGDLVCDKARIETMARDGGAAFRRSGFTSIRCDATGDVVDLR